MQSLHSSKLQARKGSKRRTAVDEAAAGSRTARQSYVDAFRCLSNNFLSHEMFKWQHRLVSHLASLPGVSPSEQLSMPDDSSQPQ